MISGNSHLSYVCGMFSVFVLAYISTFNNIAHILYISKHIFDCLKEGLAERTHLIIYVVCRHTFNEVIYHYYVYV